MAGAVTVADSEAVVFMAAVVSEVVVSTVVEGLPATTAVTVVLAEPTGDSAGRVEWDVDRSGVRAGIPPWGAGSLVEERGLAMELHPTREPLTASGMASGASLMERVSESAMLRL